MEKVRISVANLATRLIEKESGTIHYFGIKPKNRIQALGGAAQLTGSGVEFLTAWCEAADFEFDPEAGVADARFVVNENLMDQVFAGFERIAGKGRSYGPIEMDPISDIWEELVGKEFPDTGTILTRGEVRIETGGVEFVYRGCVRQPPPPSGRGTSSREKEGIPTRRLFRLYDLITPKAIVSKILTSAVVRELTTDELATTEGGSRKGTTADGTEIADNLFLVP